MLSSLVLNLHLSWMFPIVFTNQGVNVIITPTVPVTAPPINPQTLLQINFQNNGINIMSVDGIFLV
jgi:hypothetical protein